MQPHRLIILLLHLGALAGILGFTPGCLGEAGSNMSLARWEEEPMEPAVLGLNIDPDNPAGMPDSDALADLGLSWVRLEAKLQHPLPTLVQTITALNAAKIKSLIILDYSTCPRTKPLTAAVERVWAIYLDTCLRGFEQVVIATSKIAAAYQVWNEQDFPPGDCAYCPGLPPAFYAKMLQRVRALLDQRQSKALLITGGHASGDPNYVARVIAASPGGVLPVNGLAVHPYGRRVQNFPPNWGFGEMADLLKAYAAYDLPLWISEAGLSSDEAQAIAEENQLNMTGEVVQAQYLTAVHKMLQETFSAQIEALLWFCWSDGMVPSFGLVDREGRRKPAFEAMAALHNEVSVP